MATTFVSQNEDGAICPEIPTRSVITTNTKKVITTTDFKCEKEK
jgi:hypothetical protein